MVSVAAPRFLSVSPLNLKIWITKETLRKRSAKTLTINKNEPILEFFSAPKCSGYIISKR